ncbi:secretin and TonB N-terminal domain-containing protein [Halanaerobacter jeridensis]|uniref:Type IV pilus assembly protein PilQ n=1 Tax=Halanaerobacter jeridensis TaxID=706427 RepID=A0A939BRN2_9FIRM|nr:type IV pilus assembly protein PilQ [Halanaerobacter jeridensis]
MRKKTLIFVLLLLTISCMISAQGLAQNDELVTLKVRQTDITNVLAMITEQLGVNMIPDKTVQGKVTLNLEQVKLDEVLQGLKMAYDYKFTKVSDKIYLISKQEQENIEVEIRDSQLTLHILRGDIRKVLKEISSRAPFNIIMDQSVTGIISINFKDVPLETGLTSLLQINGFSVSKSNNIYRVTKADSSQPNSNLSVSVINGQVSVDVANAKVIDIIRQIFNLNNQDMVLFGRSREKIDLKLKEAPLDKALEIILSGTRLAYMKKDGTYYIGDKNISNPSSYLFNQTKLIPLDHIKVTEVPKRLPRSVRQVEVKVLEKQNAILATGTKQGLKALQGCIDKMDHKAPQIVVEALIVEISQNQNQNPVYKLGMNYDNDEQTTLFDTGLGKLTYKSVLELPSDFHVKLQSLVSQGQATVKANPNITTLNGQEASINVGMVQYYEVKEYDEDDNTEVTEYQSINAGVNLSVTPWVGNAGGINMKLEPSVSNISGAAAEGPPEISERKVSTNVRVQDGQTIVIGGLIQDVGSESTSKVPLLGDIPVLGALFRSKNSNVDQRELVIYITPHLLEDGQQKAGNDKEKMIKKAEERMKN